MNELQLEKLNQIIEMSTNESVIQLANEIIQFNNSEGSNSESEEGWVSGRPSNRPSLD